MGVVLIFLRSEERKDLYALLMRDLNSVSSLSFNGHFTCYLFSEAKIKFSFGKCV